MNIPGSLKVCNSLQPTTANWLYKSLQWWTRWDSKQNPDEVFEVNCRLCLSRLRIGRIRFDLLFSILLESAAKLKLYRNCFSNKTSTYKLLGFVTNAKNCNKEKRIEHKVAGKSWKVVKLLKLESHVFWQPLTGSAVNGCGVEQNQTAFVNNRCEGNDHDDNDR